MKQRKAELIPFISQDKREVRRNLDEFIRMCKHDLTTLNDHRLWRGWDDHRWPLASFVKFSNTRKQQDKVKMDGCFIDFAKAYARYIVTHKHRSLSTIMPFLRALEFAVVESGIDICDIGKRTLDRAVEALVEKCKSQSAYQSAGYLRELSEFLYRKGLTTENIHGWKPNIIYEDNMGSFTRKSEEELNKKMPNAAAMSGLAKVFSERPTDPYDIFVTSLWVILMSSGMRISEALSLSVDALKIKDINGHRVCYLQYYARKKGGWHKAPVDEEMEPVLIEAFQRLKDLTAESRKVAKHFEAEDKKYKKNTDYRRKLPSCSAVKKYRDKQTLSMDELSEVVGLCGRQAHRLTSADHKQQILNSSIAGVESWLNTHGDVLQPKDFPVFDKLGDGKVLKYSDALFCFRQNELNEHSTRNFTFRKITNSNISQMLAGKNSFFVRHGVRDESGEIVKTNSHAPRHLLNTIAQNINLSQWDIARMFGRVTPKHNKAYDHTSGHERAKKSLHLTQGTSLFGQEGINELSCKSPINKVTYDQLNISPTTHSTEYGLCVNHFSYSPCSKYRNCLSCSKHVVDAHDAEKIKQIKTHCQVLKNKLDRANKKVGSVFGVENYIDHLTSEINETEQLISIIGELDGQEARFLHRVGIKDDSCIGRAIDSIENNMPASIGVSA